MAVPDQRPQASDDPGTQVASASQKRDSTRRRGHPTLRRLLGTLGPGLVTGAADDDPSGIATYSQTGAQFGYGQLWTALSRTTLIITFLGMAGAVVALALSYIKG
jgi:Mn2+/Fe2+ NRAMP family transporter